jgi:membrane protein implicated in regulation of membrane protease activity
MFALLALIAFILGFILALLDADTGKISVLYIGLAFLAAHFVFTGWADVPWGRRQP